MQLFSVDQQRSQALEAHAASFASIRVRNHFFGFVTCSMLFNEQILYYTSLSGCEQVPGNDKDSILISFATKTSNAGQTTSKLHVIELGAQPGGFYLSLLFSVIVILSV